MRKPPLKVTIIILCALLLFSLSPHQIFASVPAAPTGLTATAVSANQINLTWNYTSGASTYYVYRSNSYDGSYSYIGAESSQGYIDADLSADTTYYYKVQAINSDGSSSYSTAAHAATSSALSSNLTATSSGSNQVYLSWPSVSGANYYTIYRSTSYSGTYSQIGATSSNTYTDTSVSSGVTYYYKIQGINSSGSVISYSSIANATAGSASSGDLTATSSGSSQITLSWPSISGTSYYYVSRSTAYSGTYTVIATTSSTNYTDSALSAGTAYYYKIQGINSSGSTIYYSSIANATAGSASSGDLTAMSAGSSQIYLSWPAISQASHYYISRSASYSGPYTIITNTPHTSYTDSGLSSGSVYYYKVQAVNGAGVYIYTSSAANASTSSSSSSASITSDRLAGDNRYQTSREIAKIGWNSSYYAVIVSGENYPDALCSAPLASKYNAPILLTSKDRLDTHTRDELSRLNVKSVFLIGGTSVISSSTEQTVRNMGISVSRIAGSDRYDTSIKIAQSIGENGQAVIASGDNFADALSIAPIAAIKGMPILLTSKNSLSGSLKQYLQNSVQTTYVVGGTNMVSNTVFNQLPSPQRLSGTNRYETNVNIIKTFASQLDLNTCYLATGQAFPDALAGAALASLKKSPIVLVNTSLDQSTSSFINERSGTINKVVVFGGTGVVPNTVLTNISAANSNGLSAPANLAAVSQSLNQINLTWNSVSGASYYYVYRSTSYSGTYNYVSSVTSPGYTDTGLSANTPYYYKVLAGNSSGQSAYSSITSATTSSSGYPSTPTGLSAVASGSSQISLSWNSASNATSYFIYRSSSYSGTYTYITSTNSTSYTDSGLSTYTPYYYKILAVNSTGSSSYSAIVNATTSTYSYPAAPNNFSASPLNSTEIFLSWSSVSSAADYYIYRASSYSGTYTYIGAITSTTYTDSGLSPDTTYYYKVMAYNSYGTGPYSNIEDATTGLPAPAALTVASASSSSLNLSWSAVGGAASYIVSRSASLSGSYSNIVTVTTNSYTNTGLSPNTTYYYKVQAVKNSVSSSYSTAASAVTLAASVPGVPTGLTATAESSSQINLTWTNVSGATSYIISRSSASSGTYTSITTVTTNSYSNSGLSANTTLFYKVQAVNSAGSGSPSSVVSATTLAGSIPSVPTGLIVSPVNGTNQLNLTWTSVTGAASYTVFRSASEGGPYTNIAADVNAANYSDSSGLTSNTTYYYKVSAVNSAGSSAQTSAASAATPPPAPAVTTAPSGTSITLNWDAPSGAATYNVYWCLSSDGTYNYIANVAARTYTHSGLTTGTTYYYKVSAVNNSGTLSSYSPVVSSVTVPPAPTGLSASAVAGSSSAISLSWNASSGAASYTVLRSTSATGDFSAIASGVNLTNYSDSGLAADTSYYYKVRAVNSAGSSSDSDPAAATTNP